MTPEAGMGDHDIRAVPAGRCAMEEKPVGGSRSPRGHDLARGRAVRARPLGVVVAIGLDADAVNADTGNPEELQDQAHDRQAGGADRCGLPIQMGISGSTDRDL